ncbi:hypothetical protein ACU635_14230 [[Actinomadura] parvosata]|uniref:hypothetical protein n=1 Tax=[Actinomadura] parvosata TaxID=1955412 RepID=UPI00406CE467
MLIALMVEFGFIMQAISNASRGMESEEDREYAVWEYQLVEQIAVGLGAVFLVGEVLALLSIGFRWFNFWTFLLIGLCMLILLVAAVLIPLIRISGTSPSG